MSENETPKRGRGMVVMMEKIEKMIKEIKGIFGRQVEKKKREMEWKGKRRERERERETDRQTDRKKSGKGKNY